MGQSHLLDTDDRAVPGAVRRFVRNRLLEVMGLVLLAATGLAAVSLATWSVADPSRNNAVDAVPQNWLGVPGAVFADELMQSLGLGAIVLVLVPLAWAARLLAHSGLKGPVRMGASWLAATIIAAAVLSSLPVPSLWVLGSGLGGTIGDVIANILTDVLSIGLKGVLADIAAFIVLAVLLVPAMLAAIGASGDQVIGLSRVFGERGQTVAAALIGRAGHLSLKLRGFARRRRNASRSDYIGNLRRADEIDDADIDGFDDDDRVSAAAARPGLLSRLLTGLRQPRESEAELPPLARVEPTLDRTAVSGEPRLFAPGDREPVFDDGDPVDDDDDAGELGEAGTDAPNRVSRTARPIKPGKRIAGDRQPDLPLSKARAYQMPPLTLLSEPKRLNRSSELSDDALEQNARMLEGVLEDFGVRGEIINVRPGPVVTLYELEPAPGIKSSRVIGLADDIARSMSAISARVAVVPGRNVIGIELPNSTRETVYLRELLAAETFEKSKQSLCLALGKNIGGEPIFADLARMPHLLIAGTTGSGKSVGINTMILSLLYRLTPEQCKLIMIDPKMLELSVYEGIPHLLAPVVTDPKKAVVALKWTVREMEDRYRKMSKLGVRNVDGFNKRVEQAMAKGEIVTRTVQTGYDPETGEPVYEQEEMDLEPMPFIVVIIDEMADLMMVAGKEIEGAVQRLAQMARAAGIHVVMATQRPSVDVITGTIKANFPTRISFQVTSKIDSRTILGEQGAEQLLGQGDMLHMAGGGRISRLHGAFVADDEVEKIVHHLKSQGAPDYVEAVTEEPDDDPYTIRGVETATGGGETGDELYDKAVAVVLRDKKVSTSYIQRRLQVGYNKAASLIERMEDEGLISAPNHAGKREILAGGDQDP